jgi:hypothetical protein
LKLEVMKRILLIFFAGMCIFSELVGQAGLGLRQIQIDLPVFGFEAADSLSRGFQLSGHYRWYDASVPYTGNIQLVNIERENTQDIFNSHQLSFSLQYRLNNRFRFFASIPLSYQQKSSIWEHSLVNDYRVAFERRVTEGIGLGDILLGGGFQLLNPNKYTASRLEVGAALKVPSGQYQATDIWYNAGPQRADVVRPVDQAIQPGDGTWGVLLSLKGTWKLWSFLGIYGETFYLSTPKDLNGVYNYRPFVSAIWSEEGENSATDQYMARGGISIRAPRSPLSLHSGIRVDGVPVNDIFGASEGFRRPGYAVSWENSLMLQAKDFRVYLALPYIYYQTRLDSRPELRYEAKTGLNRQGESSFARFMLQIGFESKL